MRAGAIFAAVALSWVLLATPGRAQSPNPEFETLTEAEIDEAVDFVLGNALFVLMHEAGHMLISEFGIPVLGREEDAVDALSALIMLEADDELFDNALVDASDGWFLSGEAADSAGADYAFWDEHSVDEQRAYTIVCLMVGQDAERFGGVAESAALPDHRREGCAVDYEQSSRSWWQVLEPHVRLDGGTSQIDIIYEPAPTAELELYAEMFREGDLLGIAKALVADQFVLDDGITFRAAACGEPNAFWDPAAREMTFCYELSQFHAQLISNYLRANR